LLELDKIELEAQKDGKQIDPIVGLDRAFEWQRWPDLLSISWSTSNHQSQQAACAGRSACRLVGNIGLLRELAGANLEGALI